MSRRRKGRGAPDEQKPPRAKHQRIEDEEPSVTVVGESTTSDFYGAETTSDGSDLYDEIMKMGWFDEPGVSNTQEIMERMRQTMRDNPSWMNEYFQNMPYRGTSTGRYRGRPEPRFYSEHNMDPRERAYRESDRTGEDPSEIYARIVHEDQRADKVKELRMRFGDEVVLTQLVRILEEMGDMESILMVLEPDVIHACSRDDGTLMRPFHGKVKW